MLTPEETDDVLDMLSKLCAKQGWKAYQQRLASIRERITPTKPAPLPPMPAGSLPRFCEHGVDMCYYICLQCDQTKPSRVNFTPCAKCDTPATCSVFDSCGRGL